MGKCGDDPNEECSTSYLGVFLDAKTNINQKSSFQCCKFIGKKRCSIDKSFQGTIEQYENNL